MIELALVVGFGVLIGVSLGAVGAGGSILAVPVLVYVAGEPPKQATASALLVVLVTSLIALGPHWRARRVRLDLALPFGISGAAGAVIGKLLSERLDPDVLMLAFAGVMVLSAVLMLRRSRAAERAEAAPTATSPSPSRDESQPGSVLVAAPPVTGVPSAARVVPLGAFVGLLTGFFGVGGGFVIVPSLVLVLGVTMTEAVGTSLAIIAINSAIAFALKSQGVELDWPVVTIFAAAAATGALFGGRLTRGCRPATLTRWFVLGVLAVAAYTAARSIAGIV